MKTNIKLSLLVAIAAGFTALSAHAGGSVGPRLAFFTSTPKGGVKEAGAGLTLVTWGDKAKTTAKTSTVYQSAASTTVTASAPAAGTKLVKDATTGKFVLEKPVAADTHRLVAVPNDQVDAVVQNAGGIATDETVKIDQK